MAQGRFAAVMRLLRSAWVLVLLVLVHGFGPGLHDALHDHHHAAHEALEGAFGCCCAAHEAEQELLQRGGPEGVPRASVADGHHDCGLCAELQRSHGVPLPTLWSVPMAARPQAVALAHSESVRQGCPLARPIARAPPSLLDC